MTTTEGDAELAASWLDEALRSGVTRVDEFGLHWMWVDDVPEVDGWPSQREVIHYFNILNIPIAGGSGIMLYKGSDRVSHTSEVRIPWDFLAMPGSAPLWEAIAKALAAHS
ncbi:MAG: hypothetical protein H0X35_09510 [Pseudonocardiales bacterium]|nr:hypothetical protein [Pseudonocardiales bacterium]